MLLVTILLIYYTVLGTLGILMNLLLLVLSLFFSPPQIKTYRILMINFALSDIAASFLMMFIAPRIIPLNLSLAHIFYGLCHYAGPFLCYASYSSLLHLFTHSMWSLLLSFAYRYYVLVAGHPTPLKLFLCVVLIYIPSFATFVVFNFTAGDPKLVMDQIAEKFPNYGIDFTTVTGITNALSPAATFSILNITIPVFPIYTAILIFRRKILWKLGENAEHLRSETKSIHKQLLKALTLQACLPILFTCGVFIFFIQAIGLASHPILECLICGIPAPIPLLSSIISIYHIRPYRQALLRFILKKGVPVKINEHHSSAVALAPQHKVSVFSLSRLHRLSVPNNS